jgi:hypothetical protein
VKLQGGHKHEDLGDDLAQHSDLSLTASWGFELLVQRSQLLPQALQLLLVLVQFLILGGTVRGRQRLRRGLGPGRLSRGRSLFFLFGVVTTGLTSPRARLPSQGTSYRAPHAVHAVHSCVRTACSGPNRRRQGGLDASSLQGDRAG